uniref:Uncharacterized protein n=1 Tax=Meloidogyne enterolobii TaxID=390850 RepID=A0A6V7XE92_MELEN|nr:unnamed protein product [Meloidogyne enterolobii]
MFQYLIERNIYLFNCPFIENYSILNKYLYYNFNFFKEVNQEDFKRKCILNK